MLDKNIVRYVIDFKFMVNIFFFFKRHIRNTYVFLIEENFYSNSWRSVDQWASQVLSRI
jgi:hypothetical protein